MTSWSIIILGASGDLATRRLIPALYNMAKHDQGRLRLIFVGAAREDIGIDELFNRSRQYINDCDTALLEDLKKRSYYQQLDFNRVEDFNLLHDALAKFERDNHITTGRMVYVAAGSSAFCDITKNLIDSGIIKRMPTKDGKEYRVLYEKPYGHDGQSAQSIERCVSSLLDQSQIFRVDHYITKALIQSLCVMRLSNPVLSAVWSKEYIDHIQIQLNEQEGLEHRGAFYDATGAIRDVVQNHMLQMIAFITMPLPPEGHVTNTCLCDQRLSILKHMSIKDVVIGQFEGYQNIEHVVPGSKTETFAVLECAINTPEWQGVPVYLKTGKYVHEKSTEIHIVFKPVVRELFGKSCAYESNILTIRVSPDTGFALRMNVAKADQASTVVPVSMDFCYRCVLGSQQPHSYEVLLRDALENDRSISVSFEEVEILWKLIDEVRSRSLPLYGYPPGSTGPQEADEFASKRGFKWL